MANSTIHLNEKVENTERKFGAALEYYPVEVINESGNTQWAMFTQSEIDVAVERATKNKEDIPKSLWESIFG
jgi:hypothetical protein